MELKYGMPVSPAEFTSSPERAWGPQSPEPGRLRPTLATQMVKVFWAITAGFAGLFAVLTVLATCAAIVGGVDSQLQASTGGVRAIIGLVIVTSGLAALAFGCWGLISAIRSVKDRYSRPPRPSGAGSLLEEIREGGGGGFFGRRLQDGSAVVGSGEVAALVVGPPRVGKTTGVIIPSVIGANGPVVSTSVRTDVLLATYGHRRQLGECWLFDPSGQQEVPPGVKVLHWSPTTQTTTWDEARLIARSMTETHRRLTGDGGSTTGHFSSRAAALLAPLLLLANQTNKAMDDVLTWIQSGEWQELIGDAAQCHARAGLSLEGVMVTEDRERSGIISTAQTVIEVYGGDAATELGHNVNFDPKKFAASTDTLYVTSDAEWQDLTAPLIVALLDSIRRAQADRANRKQWNRDQPPVLFALDEAANIAPIPNLPNVITHAGGSGVLYIICLQDLSKANERWGHNHGFLSLLQNRVIFPGIHDPETLRSLSEAIGTYDRMTTTVSESHGQANLIQTLFGGNTTYSQGENIQVTPILSPADFAGIPKDCALVMQGTSWELIKVDRHMTVVGSKQIVTMFGGNAQDPSKADLNEPTIEKMEPVIDLLDNSIEWFRDAATVLTRAARGERTPLIVTQAGDILDEDFEVPAQWQRAYTVGVELLTLVAEQSDNALEEQSRHLLNTALSLTTTAAAIALKAMDETASDDQAMRLFLERVHYPNDPLGHAIDRFSLTAFSVDAAFKEEGIVASDNAAVLSWSLISLAIDMREAADILSPGLADAFVGQILSEQEQRTGKRLGVVKDETTTGLVGNTQPTVTEPITEPTVEPVPTVVIDSDEDLDLDEAELTREFCGALAEILYKILAFGISPDLRAELLQLAHHPAKKMEGGDALLFQVEQLATMSAEEPQSEELEALTKLMVAQRDYNAFFALYAAQELRAQGITDAGVARLERSVAAAQPSFDAEEGILHSHRSVFEMTKDLVIDLRDNPRQVSETRLLAVVGSLDEVLPIMTAKLEEIAKHIEEN